MENYINKNLNDITYKSEFIPPFWRAKFFSRSRQKGGINSDMQLMLSLGLSALPSGRQAQRRKEFILKKLCDFAELLRFSGVKLVFQKSL